MKIIILAAGKGTRLYSENHQLPKVLRLVNNKPLLGYVCENINFVDKKDTAIVVGFKKEMVIENFDKGYTFVSQDEQNGTGHAVNCAKEFLQDYDGPVLVCYGDMPLFKKETYKNLIEQHKKNNNDCTILTAVTDVKYAYGRIVRDFNNNFSHVVEDKDCNSEEKLIKELNVGIYVFNSKQLLKALSYLKNDNSQGEYYLTDVPAIMLSEGLKVNTFTINSDYEILGVNTTEELQRCEELIKNNSIK